MNKRNMRKNAPKVYMGYLTSKQRKAVKWYEQQRKESKPKLSKLVLALLSAWHKHHYLKYEYLEIGCINKKIRKEFEEKKVYHCKKYNELSLSHEKRVSV